MNELDYLQVDKDLNDNVLLQRDGNALIALLRFWKNDYSINPLDKPVLFLLGVLFFGLCGIIYVTKLPSAGIIFIFLVLPLIIFILDLVTFIYARKFFNIYSLISVSYNQNYLEFLYKNKRPERISYAEIKKIRYVGGVTFALTGGRIFFYRRHYVVEAIDANGKVKEFFVPLDLPNLLDLLNIIIKNSNIVKIKNSKISLQYEWQKVDFDNIGKIANKSDLRPMTLDLNTKIGKLGWVFIIVALGIFYLYLRFFPY